MIAATQLGRSTSAFTPGSPLSRASTSPTCVGDGDASSIAATARRAASTISASVGTGRVGRRLITPTMPHMALQATDDASGRAPSATDAVEIASSGCCVRASASRVGGGPAPVRGGASTITRTNGSVPLGAPAPDPCRRASLVLAAMSSATRRRRRLAGSPTRTLTSTCGSCVIAVRRARQRLARRAARCRAAPAR